MGTQIYDKLTDSIKAANELYNRLVLLVGPSNTGKTGLLRQIAKEYGTTVINVNLKLSEKMLDVPIRQRTLRLPAFLEEITDDVQPPVLLDNLEILFDKDLRQNPLKLIQRLSRNKCVVATWNGTLRSGRLVYAEPSHPEYSCYDTNGILIVNMDGTATVDLAFNAQKENQQ